MAPSSNSNHLPRVPVARSVRLRNIRVFALPLASFALAVIGWGYLWNWQSGQVVLIGQVDSFRINVNSPTSGLVARMPHHTRLQWSLFDPIQAGDVIAEFDDTEYRNEVARFEFEIEKLKKELTRWQTAATAALGDAAGEANPLDEVVQHEIDLLDEARLTIELPPDGSLDEMREAPELAFEELDATMLVELDRIRTTRAELLLRVDELRLTRQNLQIRAPISGTLVDFFCAPGQQLHMGGPVATIAADHGRMIIGYLPENSPYKPEVGMMVALRSRGHGATPVTSTIEEIATQLSPIPTRLSGNPAITQWGMPIRITMPSDVEFRAGSLVDIIVYGVKDDGI
jgi:multidrug resistance efflux pump